MLFRTKAVFSFMVAKLCCFLGYFFIFREHTTSVTVSPRLLDTDVSLPIFKKKPLVIWTIDFHATPSYDLKCFLEPMGVKFIYRNYDDNGGRCKYKNNCNVKSPLRAFDPTKAINLQQEQIQPFYEAYKNDTEMKTVDAFVCFHNVALCELYEPFNKSMIIIATLRYEYGRYTKERWTAWNRNLIKYASQPWNVVGANNLYDVEYIKYFTGIQGQLLPGWGNYTNQTYTASRPGFLIAKSHNANFIRVFKRNYAESCKRLNCSVRLTYLREKYPNYYKYGDVAAHQGIVYVPYQASVMSFFEQYRMNIPIFAPSKELLYQWEINHDSMVWKRTSYMLHAKTKTSVIDPHPSQRSIPDPNSFTAEAARYWGKFCDYYHFPHITYYESIEDLIRILNTINKQQLMNISAQMRGYNIEEKIRLRKVWRNILLKVADHSRNRPH